MASRHRGPTLSLSDFDYALPAELIAQEPAATRTASRLLRVDGDAFEDLTFRDLPDFIAPGDLLILNDTRVIRARIFGRKPTGGRVEALVERIATPNEAWLQIRASHMPKVGSTVRFADADATVVERDDRLFCLRFDVDEPLDVWVERHGEVPLPPYITRPSTPGDAQRYQTVYARHAGAVAAPTAGLHFDDAMLASIRHRGAAIAFVTLHVGAGTFAPVESDERIASRNDRRLDRNSSAALQDDSVETHPGLTQRREVSAQNGHYSSPPRRSLESGDTSQDFCSGGDDFAIESKDRFDQPRRNGCVLFVWQFVRQDQRQGHSLFDSEGHGRLCQHDVRKRHGEYTKK